MRLTHAIQGLTLKGPGVCLHRVHGNLYKRPTSIEMIICLIHALESIPSTAY